MESAEHAVESLKLCITSCEVVHLNGKLISLPLRRDAPHAYLYNHIAYLRNAVK
jgi:hypothetical protein